MSKKLGGRLVLRTMTVLMLSALLLGSSSVLLTVIQPAHAITVTSQSSAAALAAAILGGGGAGIDLTSVTATLSSHTTGTATSAGTYTNPSGTYGLGPGVILSTGDVNGYNDGPNSVGGATTEYGVAETPSEKVLLDPITGVFDHFDVTQLNINFNMLPGSSTIFFNVAFGSEEYPEFVGSEFVDGFGLFVNGANIAFVGGLPVNINHPDMTAAPGTELDGVLGGSTGKFGPLVHTFSSSVNPTGNTITFIVADTSDDVLDTTVYISQLGGTQPPQPTDIALAPLTATNPVGGSHTVTAKVTNATGFGVPGVDVTFSVTGGPNVGKTGSGVTDANGDATFTYTDTGGSGTDTIVAKFNDVTGAPHTSNEVTKTWETITTTSTSTTTTTVTSTATSCTSTTTILGAAAPADSTVTVTVTTTTTILTNCTTTSSTVTQGVPEFGAPSIAPAMIVVAIGLLAMVLLRRARLTTNARV